jgi:hypothetical protein
VADYKKKHDDSAEAVPEPRAAAAA